MCSWPPEDDRIESFHRHVRDQAKAIIGADLARTEKFTTSVRDGIDIRETLRNWHTGDLYVKVVPPSRGSIEVVVFLFEVPADPERYTNRTTWYAEHQRGIDARLLRDRSDEEPGRPRDRAGRIRRGDVHLPSPSDPRRLGRPPARLHRDARGTPARRGHSSTAGTSTSPSSAPRLPPSAWRRLARRFGRKIVHVPLKRFGGQLLERLRTFHVLNGKPVRSYAADFIRDM